MEERQVQDRLSSEANKEAGRGFWKAIKREYATVGPGPSRNAVI